jgi:hypothetical protein
LVFERVAFFRLRGFYKINQLSIATSAMPVVRASVVATASNDQDDSLPPGGRARRVEFSNFVSRRFSIWQLCFEAD